MTPPSDVPPIPPVRPPRGSRLKRRRTSGLGVPIAAVVLVVAVVGGLVWWFGLRRSDVTTTAEPTAPIAATTPESGVPAPPEPLELPALEESDGVVRDLALVLSRHPRWAAWLVTDELVERFVFAVNSVAAGVSPKPKVLFLAPEGDFQVRETAGRVVIDPASYRRYDPVTEAFVSFETPAAVRLYQQLLPLFEDAHRALGFPEGTFGEAFATAIDRVLSVRVPDDPPTVELDIQTYQFTDPELEGLTRAEKHVLRLGPDNARRVQGKLRELRDGLLAAGALRPR